MSGTPGPLAYAAGDPNEGTTPQASGAAYTESSRGLPLPTATALFDIDSGTDALVRQNPANAGTLLTIGSLLLDATGVERVRCVARRHQGRLRRAHHRARPGPVLGEPRHR